MGAESSRQRTVTQDELRRVLAQERRFTEERMRREMAQKAATEAKVSAASNVTPEDSQRMLARERLIIEEKLKRELIAKQGQQAPSPQGASPIASPQPCAAAAGSLYPNLNTYSHNHYQTTAAPAHYTYTPSAPPEAIVSNASIPRNCPKPEPSETNIECETCGSLFGRYIYQCQGGHSACQECKNSLRKCGICYTIITTTRSLALESHLEKVIVTCKNENDGCRLSFKVADMTMHEKTCPFRELICPLENHAGCSWKGKISELSSHFQNTHPQNCATVAQELTIQDIVHTSQKLYLMTLGSYNFILHVAVLPNEQNIKMAVQLCGHGASKWDYEIHIYKKSDPKKKFVHSEICTDRNTQIKDIFSSNKCTVLPAVYIINFANMGSMNYKVFIKRPTTSDAKVNNRPAQRNNRNRRYGRGTNQNRVVS